MRTLVLRVSGALVALLGLALAGLGAWLLSSLGTSGTATFTAEPEADVVVLDPQVLNRVDSPMSVTVSSEPGARLWAGVARPSDAGPALGDGARTRIGPADVSDWSLGTTEEGSGEASDPTAAEVWQRASTSDGSITVTIDQAEAPQTLVVAAPQGQQLDEVEMSTTDGSWGAWAIGLLVGGIVLVLLGLGLLLLARRGRAKGAGEPSGTPARRGSSVYVPAEETP